MRFNRVTTSLALTILFLSIHLQAYNPVDSYTISCGTTGKSFDGERTWTGDIGSKLLSHEDSTVSADETTQSPSTNQVPYTSARLSHSQFNYSFPVSAGPKFLRLFFYPASYLSFPRTDASFTVQCNQYTLFNGFNASLNADTENTETIFREYVVYVDDAQRLNLSFTPSQPNCYAFINGIEVLSMPSDLYYTSEYDVGIKLVGHETLFSVESIAALETEYRINVGGEGISPGNDTGLFRNWVGHYDYDDYLMTSNLPNNMQLTEYCNSALNITVNPDYVAPKELYSTALGMGKNITLNKMSNLTWEFPVDSGFNYMIRLHFCELNPKVNDISDRVFFIYIASELADGRADVMRWNEKQKGFAVHRDYAILIPNNNTHEKVYLLLQIHPHETAMDTVYSEPFLNGLEIFKLSEAGSNNLAGPKTDTLQTLHNITMQTEKRSRLRRTTITYVVAGVISGVVFISFVVYFVLFCVTTKSKSKSTNTRNSSLPSDLCCRFSLAEIKSATNNFDEVFIVGVGGFGHVYKGYINCSFTPVAIKRLKPDSQQGAREFLNEIEMLSQLRHLNLVPLIGYCNDSREMILVYDLMTRGNLRDHLYNTDNPPLTWKQRLHICIGAARGLHYLHTGAKHMIIHRDVKTTNILLDDKWVAKVSDFGLSRVGPMGLSKSHVSTAVKGSFGYLDPEYYKRYRLMEKSDVYSFGVVLFEILCARPPLIRNAEMQQVSLANWARHCYQSGTVAEIVDPTLKGRIAPECFKKFCEIGVSCLLEDGRQRPSMNDVVWMLEFALQLQECAEQHQNVCIVIEEVKVNEKEDDELTHNSIEGIELTQQCGVSEDLELVTVVKLKLGSFVVWYS